MLTPARSGRAGLSGGGARAGECFPLLAEVFRAGTLEGWAGPPAASAYAGKHGLC
jgi:hypothetical protein